MGLLLREALRRLCVEFGWSYAVFWRLTGRNNQMNLVWEDGHCERISGALSISGFEAMDLLLREKVAQRNSREPGVVELGSQIEDRVAALVIKMMVPQVHVVGDGIIGQAALAGNHQWILRGHLNSHGCASKVLSEMNQQFLAGIQTMAVIPVLPHGVVQLGSTKMVIEDIQFINHVRSLFAKLGCVPGLLLSDTAEKGLSQKILMQESFGTSNMVDHSGDAKAKISRFIYANSDQFNQHPISPNSVPVTQPSCSVISQLDGRQPVNAVYVPLSKQTSSGRTRPHSDFSQQMNHPGVSPMSHLNNQPKSGPFEAQVRLCSPDVASNQNSLLLDSGPSVQYQTPNATSDVCLDSLTYLEEQLLSVSSNGPRQLANSNGLILDGCRTSQLRSRGSTSQSSLRDSRIDVFLDRSESVNDAKDLGRFGSLRGGATEKKGGCATSTSTEDSQSSNGMNDSVNNQVLSGNPQLRISTFNDLFQSLCIPCTEPGKYGNCNESLLDIQDVWLSNSKPEPEYENYQGSVLADSCPAINRQGIEDNGMSEILHALNKGDLFSSSQPSSGSDLFDILGFEHKPGPEHGHSDDVFVHRNEVIVKELSTDVSACKTQQDMAPVVGTFNDVSCNGIFSEGNPDQLLDAIVSKIDSGSKHNLDDVISCKTSLTKNSSSSLATSSVTCGWVPSSEQMPSRTFDIPPLFVKTEASGSVSVKSGGSVERTESSSKSDVGYKSQISLWVENGQNIKTDSIPVAHGKRVDEVGKLNRKRARPGENPRPRPKDRQMIQDRIKELREIVPNGAKCSIDALLEKTIKHMLFLQSVTKHADKLKETGEPKIISKEGGLLLKDNFDGGATWAFEVGSQSMICPIIVEDLNPPRQMLVEMLCEERGHFLEIADLIRGLGLTILKGVMEARDDKVWARFAVEANRDVTRMEIFISLVRLLEPTAGSSLTAQGVDPLKMPHNRPCNTLHPSSIPATGLSDGLR